MNPRQRRGGICIVVNQFEDDEEGEESAVDIDLDDVEDDFVFEDELSSTMGSSSMTVLEGNNSSKISTRRRARACSVKRRERRGAEDAGGAMPLLRKLFTLARCRGRGGDHHSSGLNGQMEMNRRGQSRNENKLAAAENVGGKKGWWLFLEAISFFVKSFIS